MIRKSRLIAIIVAMTLVLELVATSIYPVATVEGAASGPVLLATYPANQAVNMPANGSLSMTFDENVVKGVGAISIRRVSTNEQVESINVTSSAVTIHSTNRNVVTIQPASSTLLSGNDYYVLIDSGAFQNETRTANYGGISSASDWTFRAVAADNAAPAVINRFPLNNATIAVGETLTLTFDKTVYASNGTIVFRNVTDSFDEQVISVVSTEVQGSGSNMIQITPSIPLTPGMSYSVSISAGAFRDGAGNAMNMASLGNWTFQTMNHPITMPALAPGRGMAVALNTPLTLSFDQDIISGTGNIVIKRLSNNTTFQTINVTDSSLVSISGSTVSISHNAFEPLTSYYVQVDPGTFRLAGNPSVSFYGIMNASIWGFTTAAGADTTRPTVTAFSPANNGVQSALTFNLEITFSEPVYPGTGNIVIKNAQNDSVVRTISVTSTQVVGGGTNKITITPGVSFTNNSQYYVQIGSQAFVDAAGNYYLGIGSTNTTTWRFRITQDTVAPTISSLTPSNGATSVQRGVVLSATFSEPVQVGSGAVTIRRVGSSAGAINATLAVDPTNNRRVTITPNSLLDNNINYYVEMAVGSVQDLAGNNFAGILNQNQWTFRTGVDTTAPVISKAEMVNSTQILLTYNEALDTSSVPSTANYYVTVNDSARAVVGVSVSGQTVRLTLQSGVLFGQIIKLSYTRGSSPIRDTSQNQAANLNSYSVSNNQESTQPKPLSGHVTQSTITLLFNESLNTINANGHSQFSVYVGGNYRTVTSATNAGNTVILGLSSAITEDQSVYVNYTPGNYPLFSTSGTAVLSFSNFYVLNPLDKTAPVLQSIAASGTKLTLTYNEGLSPNSVPLTGNYSVLVNNAARSVTKVEVANNEVILTLASAVTTGQTVLVTYQSTAPFLFDLANNIATSFSGVPAGSVNSGTGTGLLTSATLQDRTLTLTFSQTLSPAHVPSASLFYVKIQGSFFSVSSIAVSGSTVTMQMSRAPNAGETVTVSYTASGSILRTSSGTVITAFTDIPVSLNGGITGLPTGYEVSDLGGLNLASSLASTSTDTAPSGRGARKYTLSSDRIMLAYSTARSHASLVPRVQFTVPDMEAAAIVSVPVRQLEDAQKASSNASFAVKYKDIVYEIPLSNLDFTKLGQLAGTTETSGSLVIKIDNQGSNAITEITNAVRLAKGQLLSTPTYFQVALNNGSTEQVVEDFKGYITRSLKVPTTLNARNTAVVWLDPATGALSYVPTKVTTSGNPSTVTFKRKGNSAYAVISNTASFTDIEGHWAKNDMVLLSSKFITEGRTATKFEPQKPITRGEFATYIARGLGLSGNKQAAAKFKDVNTSTTMAAYIGAASEAGIVLGNPDGTFKPNNSITREEMGAMMIRAATAAGIQISLTQTQSAYFTKFKDRSSLATWAQPDMAKAIEIGVIGGMTADTLGPKSDATRAQAAVMIKRLLVYIDFLDA